VRKKIALVSGGLGGLGSAICNHLLANGIEVLRTSSRKDVTDNKTIFHWDMAQSESAKMLITHLDQMSVVPDYFIHSAHVFSETKLFPRFSMDEMCSSFNANITNTLYMAQQLAMRMRKKGSSKMLFIGSAITQTPTPGKLLYLVEKMAMEGMVKGLHEELKDRGISLHIIHPGLIKTQQLMEKISLKVLESVPENKFLAPEDVARKLYDILTSPQAPVVHLYLGGNDESV